MKKVCFLLFVVVMVACKKDDEPTHAFRDLLLKHTSGWVRTSEVVNVGTGTYDVFNDPDITRDCDKDDATIFDAAGTYKVVSTVECYSGEGSIIGEGTWSLSSDEKTLTVIIGGDTQVFTVLEADDTHIKANISTEISGQSVTGVVGLKPKS
ncbi:MAG: hypothetical protein WDO15_20020 [Bacteroidota bacterium]